MKALVVDDDLALADVVSFTLRKAGFDVIVAYDGLNALERWQTELPDLIILDLNLPKFDGLSVCRQIRAQASTPIIILSVRGEEDDIVKGLKLGADDYIVKPFSPRQLVARVEAVLRRAGASQLSPAPVAVGELTLDPSRCCVYYGDGLLAKLTPLECRLLQLLMINKGQVLLTNTLIDQIWGPSGGDRAMLKQLIYRLRQKIESSKPGFVLIETVPGAGYSLNISSEKRSNSDILP